MDSATEPYCQNCDQKDAQIRRLREALEFYAATRTYLNVQDGMFSEVAPISRDMGNRARAAQIENGADGE